MAEEISEHPIIAYLTFALPFVLLVTGLLSGANVLLIALTILWLGIAFAVFYLPLSSDDDSRA